jgi:CMP/dCMP kinase
MAVITISRQYGSGGDEIAQEISRNTGFRLFDKHVLAQAAIEAGLTEQEAYDFCEDNYRTKNVFDRLFGVVRPVASVRVWKEDTSGVRTAEELALDEEQALACIRRAVETAYQMGNIVIVGRGGQVILKDYPDVLHVRVTAPLEERFLRVRRSAVMSEQFFSDSVEARRAAQNLLEKNDVASANYLRRFYGVDWADPQLYALIINTGKVGIEQAAAAIIVAACR